MSSFTRTTTHCARSSSPSSRDRAVGQNGERLLHEGLVGQVAGNQQIYVFRRADEPKPVDGKSAEHDVGDSETIEFPRQRNQVGLGRGAGYFPFRFRLAVHASQASWLANRNTPLG
jgi:hypothetical protein